MKIRALALALTLALAVPAVPALAAATPPSAPAVTTVHAGWLRAQRLMQRGWWCERTAPGRFACTLSVPSFHGQGRLVGFRAMYFLIRHDWECSGFGPVRWLCVPH